MYHTKDSGQRSEYASGMVRDTEEGKPRFDLLHPLGVPYQEQMLTRFAMLMARGADKYGDRNWEKARGDEELKRYYSSAERHLQQWIAGENDEDHAAAVMFNILAGETVKYRMRTEQPDADCYTLPDGECVSEACKLHSAQGYVECPGGFRPWDEGAGLPRPTPTACGNCGEPFELHDPANIDVSLPGQLSEPEVFEHGTFTNVCGDFIATIGVNCLRTAHHSGSHFDLKGTVWENALD